MKNPSVKSSSICCARTEPRHAGLAAVLLLVLSSAVLLSTLLSSAAAAKKSTDPEEIFNPLLGVAYSHWLVGPIVQIATEKEVERYLELTSDDEARAFIEAFWDKRNEGAGPFEKNAQQLFEIRETEADKRFTEAAYSGSRTDRGTVYVLHGEPETIEFDTGQKVGDPTLEVWKYPKDAPPGLDGKPPKRSYRFIKLGELTVLYEGRNQQRRPDLRRNRGF